MNATEQFVAHRRLLFTVAYEMLGSVADADDVVQETWLRWQGAHSDLDRSEEIRDPRAYLVRITTRVALNQLRTKARRREDYVGPWLPEPLLTSPDVAEDVALSDSLTTAMLLVLETLGAEERAVFVLREVFGFSHDEIAAALGKTSAAVRQIAHRARGHVAARRPRHAVAQDELVQVIDRFREATEHGDIAALIALFHPDVVLTSDGGGVVSAARRPIVGVDKVFRFLLGVADDALQMAAVDVNGAPGVVFRRDQQTETVVTFDVVDGLVTHLYVMRNPDKLHHIDETRSLTR